MSAFLAVAQLSSFTRAGDRLHVTQAGLSAMIRELENQLGVRLFDRTTRSVTLTQAGQMLLPVAERVVTELEGVHGRVVQLGAESATRVRIAVTSLMAVYLLPRVVELARERHPELVIQVADVDPLQIQQMVERNETDLGFGAFLRGGAGLERVPLFRFELALTVPAGEAERGGRTGRSERGDGAERAERPARGRAAGARAAAGASAPAGAGTELRWQRLNGRDLVGLAADNSLQQHIEQQLARSGVDVRWVARFNTLETVIAMAAAGLGQAIVPTFTRPACARHGLALQRLSAPVVALDFYRINRKGGPLPEGAMMLLDLIREVLSDRSLAGA
ncbi:MAG: LysR family transcriptional regulator [Burkholderiales bacterium]|nr:LysR family transcriptional regulator [Burkholderiales bacterium]